MNIRPILIALAFVAAAAGGALLRQGPGTASLQVSPDLARDQAAAAAALPPDDRGDFEEARHGFIARPSGQIRAADGLVLRDFSDYAFLEGPMPDTVHPGLWRHARLNAQVGLFKVTEGVWQLRGFDIANMTLIAGKSGWIVVDPLSARESARFALDFARQHLGDRPVSALIFTHAHADHFGGAQAIATPAEAARRKLPVIAPAGFMEEATSENVLVGTGMARRSMYQFGKNLPRTARGNVDTGLGKEVVYGSLGVLPPNITIDRPEQKMDVDGVEFVFHNVPGAECPAELSFSIPALKLYDGAENLAQTLHNLLPIRGAKVRDALQWSRYLDEALEHAKDAEIYIGSHNWPIRGNARIRDFITVHRDVYKYIHDQTVRHINAGRTPREIAELVRLPAALTRHYGARGYYGDVRHNVKAVYQFYLGFYDGNPANLDPLPPAESGRRWVALLGGVPRVVAAARLAFDAGDYRWAAELLNHAVMADASASEARELLARCYEQLGYRSEAATWRNAYLTGAQELRTGAPAQGISKAMALDMLREVPTERFLEAMAAALNGPAAENTRLKINLVLTDAKESWVLWIDNAVLHFRREPPAPDAQATLSLTREILVKMLAGTAGARDTLLSDDLKVTGSRIDLARFFGLLDKASGAFPIVTR